eukprot:15544-Heterococcus_DN1.PRE.2
MDHSHYTTETHFACEINAESTRSAEALHTEQCTVDRAHEHSEQCECEKLTSKSCSSGSVWLTSSAVCSSFMACMRLLSDAMRSSSSGLLLAVTSRSTTPSLLLNRKSSGASLREGLWHNIDDALVLTAHVEQCNVQHCYQVLLIHSMTAADRPSVLDVEVCWWLCVIVNMGTAQRTEVQQVFEKTPVKLCKRLQHQADALRLEGTKQNAGGKLPACAVLRVEGRCALIKTCARAGALAETAAHAAVRCVRATPERPRGATKPRAPSRVNRKKHTWQTTTAESTARTDENMFEKVGGVV